MKKSPPPAKAICLSVALHMLCLAALLGVHYTKPISYRLPGHKTSFITAQLLVIDKLSPQAKPPSEADNSIKSPPLNDKGPTLPQHKSLERHPVKKSKPRGKTKPHALNKAPRAKPKHKPQSKGLSGERFDQLVAIMYQRINRNKHYPRHAKRRRLQGKVLVYFRLSKNGRVHHVKLLQSSGFEVLDQAALQTLIDAQPFAGVNKYIEQEQEFTLPILFRLKA